MVFASGIFLYGFLPLFLALYFLTPNRWRPPIWLPSRTRSSNIRCCCSATVS